MAEIDYFPALPSEPTTDKSASLLEMAQKVHDDFVEAGKTTAEQLVFDAQTKHDELIANAQEFHDISILEAESTAASIVEDAQLTAFSTVNDANLAAANILANIEDNKLNLEASILKLQEFEATYRNQLQALVSGAQATLAVAQLAAEDQNIPEFGSEEDKSKDEVDSDPAAEESDAEVVRYHLDVNPGPVYLDSPIEDDDSEPAVVVIGLPGVGNNVEDDSDSDKDAKLDENEVDEADSVELETPEAAESDPEVVVYTLADSIEPDSYDPLRHSSVIDSETVASILAASGLNNNPEPIYYDPLAQRSGTDPEIAGLSGDDKETSTVVDSEEAANESSDKDTVVDSEDISEDFSLEELKAAVEAKNQDVTDSALEVEADEEDKK